MRGIGCPSTRGCLSPTNWEIASMGCCTMVDWFGTKRMQRGNWQRTLLRKRSFNQPMFSPMHS